MNARKTVTLPQALVLTLVAGSIAPVAMAQNMDPRLPVADWSTRYLPDGTITRHKGYLHGRPVWERSFNLNSARAIGADKVWVGGSTGYLLSGAGQRIALFEVGGVPMFAHIEFGGRVGGRTTWPKYADESVIVSSHATHVAGTLAGRGIVPAAIGMAPAVVIWCWDSADDVAEMALEAAAGTRLSSHSYGWHAGWEGSAWYGDPSVSLSEDYKFGYYEFESRTWDQLCCANQALLPVVAAGNNRNDAAGPGFWIAAGFTFLFVTPPGDGGSTGYDTIPGGKTVAKNVLTVGAVEDITGGYTGASSVIATSFTGYGPTDDGRIKPDVVANGSNLFSTDISGASSAYSFKSGTSMATPAVTGAGALLLEQFGKCFPGTIWLSSTLKGLIIHSASEAGPSDGPDYQFGWGLVNVATAAEIIEMAAAGTAEIIQDGYTGAARTYSLIPTGGPIRVTLCYLDEGGPVDASPSLDPTKSRLVNDLDATLIRSWTGGAWGAGSIAYQPWRLNPASPSSAAVRGDNDLDNVEVIDVSDSMLEPIGSGAVETWTLQIKHEKLAAPAGAYRTMSIIITGARIP